MLIGLHDAEKDHLKNKTFPNLALMKISNFMKGQGHDVEWWQPMKHYDEVYSSKVFDFTPENEYLPIDTKKGGTGYGLYEDLPQMIDCCQPDYSIYPECDYSIGFLTRGCPNKCEWCYVPKKEGEIRPYAQWYKVVRPDSKKVVLMDNNILASDWGLKELERLSLEGYQIDLNQGMDIRLLNDDNCKTLSKVNWLKYIRFSCDVKSQLPYFEKMLELFEKYKMPKSKVFIYVLVRKDLNDADYRVQELHKMCKSFNIYAQAERNDKKGIIPSKIQLEFAQRYVYGRSYKKENWEQYCERLEIKEI